MIDSDFEGLRQTAIDSRLGRATVCAARAMTSAWETSRLASLLAWAAAFVTSGPVADRIRFGALVLFWAGLGRLAMLAVVPPYVAPGLPRFWIVSGTVAALAVAVWSNAFARAWPDSRTRRAVQKREP